MSKWRIKSLGEVIEEAKVQIKANKELKVISSKYLSFLLYSVSTILLLRMSQIVLDWSF